MEARICAKLSEIENKLRHGFIRIHKRYIGADNKLILDNSGWGEYDRTTADIFCQHIAYFFPFKHHKDMFLEDEKSESKYFWLFK